MKSKELGKNLFLLAFSLCLALGVLEAGLRLSIPHPAKVSAPESVRTHWVEVPERVWTEYDPVLGWYHQRSKAAVLETPQVKASLHTNSAGMRGSREYLREKPEGVHRSVFLGDSFTFGFGVEDDEVFPRLLEKALPGQEALNFGVAGYGLDQMLMLYRTRAADYHADDVFIGVFPEDFWRCTRAFADSGHAKPYFALQPDGSLTLRNNPVPPPYTLDRNQFPDMIQQSSLVKFLETSLLYRTLKRALIRLAKNIHLVDPDTTPEWQIGSKVLVHLISEIRANGSRPVLILVPSEGWAKSARRDSTQKSLLRLAAREKVDLVNLQPVFYEAVHDGALTDYYIEGDWHWTARGHELAAREIRRFLEGERHV